MGNEKYVYGWYCYKDGKDVEFRYPAAKSDNLKIDGRKVTVEIKSWTGWHKRSGKVAWSGGNYTVTPA